MVLNEKYPWKRLWSARLADTGTESGASRLNNMWLLQRTSKSKLFVEIENIPCLILLGEPGSGKTETLKMEYKNLRDRLNGSNDVVDLIDVEGITDREHLEKTLFENSKFIQWKNGTHNLTIFLDSLDRALMPVSTAVTTISQGLRYVDIKRLKLRIACRDIAWSFSMASDLSHIWREAYESPRQTQILIKNEIPEQDFATMSVSQTIDENPSSEGVYDLVQVYQLEPIEIEDIVVAAIANDIPHVEFIQTVKDLDVLPLATLPITLECLFGKYKQGKLSFGDQLNRVHLYHDCCKSLCTTRSYNPDDQFTTRLEQRFEQSKLLAAITLLSNRDAVNLDNSGVLDLPVLSIDEILNLPEQESIARDTLSTALFKGTNRRRFVHRSFAEFLAACYLVENQIPPQIILKISSDTNGNLAPQLHEMLRWLADMDNRMFKAIITQEPALLLTQDLSILSSQDYRAFLYSLFNLDDQYLYLSLANDIRFDNINRFRINHPSLPNLIPQFLNDKSRSNYLRRFILELIDKFQITGLDFNLSSIVLDITEDYVLRRLAASIIYEMGSLSAKLALKSLIYGQNEDQEDELKGYALLSLWPEHITAGEVFQALVRPKRESYFGAYQMFLSPRYLIDPLLVKDLPVALNWVSKQLSQRQESGRFHHLIFPIMQKAWSNIEDDRILEAFAYAALSQILKFEPIFDNEIKLPKINTDNLAEKSYEDFLNAKNERYNIITILLPTILNQGVQPHHLLYHKQPLIIVDDLDWLIERLSLSHQLQEEKFWATIIQRILGKILSQFDKISYIDIDKIYIARQQSEQLHDLTKTYFDAWMFDDPATLEARDNYFTRKKFEAESRLPQHIPSPTQRIKHSLTEIALGNIDEWINLVFSLLLLPDGGHHQFDLIPDLIEYPGWEHCSVDIQEKITEAAKIYTLNREEYRSQNESATESEDWVISGNHVPYSEIAGYIAMFLILIKDSQFLDRLSEERWQRWAPIILWYPFDYGIRLERAEQDKLLRSRQEKLILLLYNKASSIVLLHIQKLLETSNKYFGNIHILHRLDNCYDSALELVLLTSVIKRTLSPESLSAVLEYLLKHRSIQTRNFIEDFLTSLDVTRDQDQILVSMITAWLKYPVQLNWLPIWKCISVNEEVANKVIEQIANREYDIAFFGEQMSADQIAEFFIWLEERYPHIEDPNPDGVHVVSIRENIGYFKRSLINYLKGSEATNVLSAIGRIAEHFPDYEWLQFVRTEIQRTALETDWQPLSPTSVLNLRLVPKEKWYQRLNLMFNEQQGCWTAAGTITGIAALIIALIAMIKPFESSIVSTEEKSDSAQFTNIPFLTPSTSIILTSPNQEQELKTFIVNTPMRGTSIDKVQITESPTSTATPKITETATAEGINSTS